MAPPLFVYTGKLTIFVPMKKSEFSFIDDIAKTFGALPHNGFEPIGDDCTVLDMGADALVISTDMLVEDVHFLRGASSAEEVGYKSLMVNLSDVAAMGATPTAVLLSLSLSEATQGEWVEGFMRGFYEGCAKYGVALVGGDTTASMNGLVITISATGRAKKSDIAYRSGAKEHDLICITSNLGAAYMGLHLLEREKRVLKDVENPEPKFAGHEYLLERYLKPRARVNILDALMEEGIKPTSMIDLSDGLASDLRQICRSSQCGARIYLERIPIARQTTELAEEMHIDPVIAALNGGEDHELMFTVPLEMQEKVMQLGLVDVIGHITREEAGVILVTPDGEGIALKAQAFDR